MPYRIAYQHYSLVLVSSMDKSLRAYYKVGYTFSNNLSIGKLSEESNGYDKLSRGGSPRIMFGQNMSCNNS